MSPLKGSVSATPRRRSHAERTAQTRESIISAVVDSIAEVGFQRTTAAEITRRAGVTWGAVQHHFGGKDGILLAVLEDSFDRFNRRVASIAESNMPLEKRIDLFIDRAWEHFGSAHYRSTLEILMSYAGSNDGDSERVWPGQMFLAWNRVWQGLFADSVQARRESLALQKFTISTLTGLAMTALLAGAHTRRPTAELNVLKSALRNRLASASSSSGGT